MGKYKSMRGLTNEEKFKIICEIAWDKFQLHPLMGEEYIGNRGYMNWVDIEGMMYSTVPENIKRKSLDEGFTIFRDNPYTEYNLAIEAYNKFGLTMLDSAEYSGWDEYLHFMDGAGFKYEIQAKHISIYDNGYNFSKYNDLFAIYNINKILMKMNLYLLDDEYKGLCKKYNLVDMDCGYMYHVDISNIILKNRVPQRFGTRNPYTIYNINLYTKINNMDCVLLSEKYVNSHDKLKWACKNCGNIYYRNIVRQCKTVDNTGTNGLCEVCVNYQRDGYYSVDNAIKNIEEFKSTDCILYFVNVEYKNEYFQKIGITTVGIKNRFNFISRTELNYDLIYKYESNLFECIMLENYLASVFLDNSYNTNNYFSGYTECYKDIKKSGFLGHVNDFISIK